MAEEHSQQMFRAEYERELESWLQRRFRYLCFTLLALGGLDILITGSLGLYGTIPFKWWSLEVITSACLMLYIGYVLWKRNWQDAPREKVLSLAQRMVLFLGSIVLLEMLALGFVLNESGNSISIPFFFWHFTCCLFLPWTPRESLRPFIPLYIALVIIMLLIISHDASSMVSRVFELIAIPAVFLPGLGIAAWRLNRHSQSFRRRMVGKQFITLRHEFSQAKQIHESIFPKPYDDGYIRLEYSYSPMRELGGDFIHLHVGAEGFLHLSLIDVTGHGLAAALTVNRLYGELERIRAEHPLTEPGEIIRLLNRYINLTLSRHNIFATAISMSLDPYTGELAWASAGHPPIFLRREEGAVKELKATTVVLGALPDSEFTPAQQTTQIEIGDVILAYTDGAFEARDRTGKQLGLDTLRNLLNKQPSPRNWPQYIRSIVDKHQAGRIEDDILIAAVTHIANRSVLTEPVEETPATV